MYLTLSFLLDCVPSLKILKSRWNSFQRSWAIHPNFALTYPFLGGKKKNKLITTVENFLCVLHGNSSCPLSLLSPKPTYPKSYSIFFSLILF